MPKPPQQGLLCPECETGYVGVVQGDMIDSLERRKHLAFTEPHIECPHCHKRWKKVVLSFSTDEVTFVEEDA